MAKKKTGSSKKSKKKTVKKVAPQQIVIPDRKIYALREVEVELKDVKEGELFRFEKSHENDPVDTSWLIATSDGKADKESKAIIEADRIKVVREATIKPRRMLECENSIAQ